MYCCTPKALYSHVGGSLLNHHHVYIYIYIYIYIHIQTHTHTLFCEKWGEGVKSLRGRGSCHSTCHRQVRLPVAAATAMCACHTHQPPVCAPATRTSHQYVRLPHAPATAKRDQPHDQPQLNQSRRHGRAMGGPGPPCESL